MIEMNLGGIRDICVEQLEILAAVRCMCVKEAMPTAWVVTWEEKVARALKTVRLVMEVKGEVMILED